MDSRESENIKKIRKKLIFQLFRMQLFKLMLFYVVREHQRKLLGRRHGEKPSREVCESRKRVRDDLINEIRTSQNTRNLIRMGAHAFEKLCKLCEEGGLRPTQRVSVEEQVAKFLYILSHNERNRVIAFFFRRSTESISRHFHRVLRAVISLEDKFLEQPNGSRVCSEIRNNPRFYPYFKNCVGAIDGTHVRVRVPKIDAARYRGRKIYPTQNVLAACSFDLKFTYVLTGWEGTASDSRIVKNALTREDKLLVPNGKYYLVDAGFPHTLGLMTPYRGVRYHLKEYSARPPENAHELFNLQHASLRNAIERAFGVLTKRFPIIGSTTEPTYSADTQSSIVLACCIIHNYLMSVDPDEDLIAEVDRELENQEPEPTDYPDSFEDSANAEHLRDFIAAQMWSNYVQET